MKNVYISIQNKLAVLFITMLVASVSIIGYYGYKNNSKLYIEAAKQKSESELNTIAISIENTLLNIPRDLNFITNFYALERFLQWQDIGEKRKMKEWHKVTVDTLSSLLELKTVYYQIRYIDASGQEKIVLQYDQNTKSSFLKAFNKLQSKKTRAYFKEALKLNRGGIYVSEMNLNIEYGKIQYPYIPVVRFSTPVIDKNGKKDGVMVINVYAENFLSIIDKIQKKYTGSSKELFLINSEGYYLYHKEEKKRWGMQLEHGERIQNTYPKLLEKIGTRQAGTLIYKNDLFSFEKIYPLQTNTHNHWYLISKINTDEALNGLTTFELIYFSILAGTFIVVFLVVRRYIFSLLSPLKQVTLALKELAKGKIIRSDIEYNSKDEIYDLLGSTHKLLNNTKQTIAQANAVANGDFTKTFNQDSQENQLANAINAMTKRLQDVTALAENLSRGDYSGNISVEGNKDALGLALQRMIAYLQAISKVAEAIAKGDVHVAFEPQGKNDRLGQAFRQMALSLKQIVQQASAISSGDLTQDIKAKSEQDALGHALAKMTKILAENQIASDNENWLKDGISKLNQQLSGLEDLQQISKQTLMSIAKHINAASGVLYLYNEQSAALELNSSYAYVERDAKKQHFRIGEGLVGQCALEREAILFKNIEKEVFSIHAGSFTRAPQQLFIAPIIYEGKLLGVIELASLNEISTHERAYIKSALSAASAFFFNSEQNEQIKQLLESSQTAYEELQLKSEELQESNVQLEEQQQQLALQARDLQTKNKALEASKVELDKRADELERASTYKSEFLANMSHELRTPLNSIILLAKLMSQNKEQKLEAEDIKKAEVIHKAGNDLLALINDILDLSKIEAGKMEMLKDEFSTQELCLEMQDLFGENIKEKGLLLHVNDVLNTRLCTDKQKLFQVIKNLFSNALKFTKEGAIALELYQDTNSNLPIKIAIKDSGIGIDEDKLPKIFDAFRQVDGSISREFGGTGLGLSICKQIMKLLGGKIEAQSSKGEGSRFILSLPLEIRLQEKQEESESSFELNPEIVQMYEANTQNKCLEHKRILIVDDDSRNIFSISAALQEEGAETFHAFNGQEALELLEEEEVELVLMDIMMPIMDGYTCIKALRQQERFQNLPIIAITAKAMKEDRQKCLDAGANDYLTKPLDFKSLTQVAKVWIERNEL